MSDARSITWRVWKEIIKMSVVIITQFLAAVGVIYSSFAIPILITRILQNKFTLTTAYALAWVLIPGIIGALGMYLLIDLLINRSYLLFSTQPAVITLIFSSILAGISTAFFIDLIIEIAFISLFIYFPMIISLVVSFLLLIPAFDMAFQIGFIVSFSENEAVVLGGNLIITAIGVLAMSMGITFLALLNNAVNFSAAAGSMIGSGLTLIAIGLQRYYEEREGQSRNQVRKA